MKKLYIILMGIALLASCQKEVPEVKLEKILSTKSSVLNSSFIVDKLTDRQRENLVMAILRMLEDFPIVWDFYEDAYNKVGGFQIKFVVDSELVPRAKYDYATKTITYRDESDLGNVQILIEELLHVMQYHYWGSIYMNANKNVEYEAVVIRDVLAMNKNHNLSSFYGISYNDESAYRNYYDDWIYEMVVLKKGVSDVVFNAMAESHKGVSGTHSSNFNPMLLKSFLFAIYQN